MNNAQKFAYTISEAAAAIGISRSNLYKMIGEGKLDRRKLGGRVVVTAASLQRLVEEAERT